MTGPVATAAPRTGRGALVTGAVAAILASICCLGPLLLVALGVSGAWIGALTHWEPYRPLFIAVSFAALVLAARRIFRPVRECRPGEFCAAPRVRHRYQIMFWVVAALVLIALVYPYVLPFFY